MINYDSILRAFDGKPPLLQWLKMVKKALDESILKNVDITQNGEKVVCSFNFEDGTSISTPEVTLPKGDKGDKGENGVSVVSFTFDSYQVLANNTETTYKMTLSNGTETNFVIFAKNGKDGSNGNDGVSITGIDTVSNEVVGDETITTLRAHYSNDTTDDFVVAAKNGKDAASANFYLHCIKIKGSNESCIYYNVYTKKNTLTLDEALNFIPIFTDGGFYLTNTKMNVSYSNESLSTYGVVSAGKTIDGLIKLYGVVYNDNSSSAVNLTEDLTVESFVDTLIGANL